MNQARETSGTCSAARTSRHDTTTPPIAPPILCARSAIRSLVYQRSHIGGVSARHAEQWDISSARRGAAGSSIRERTRKLRKVL